MRPRPPRRRLRRPHGFTMAELLVVMAIITILAASLAVVIPIMRSKAMEKRAKADILAISATLVQYHKDNGSYPLAPYKRKSGSTWVATNALGGDVLYDALCNRHAGGTDRGWAAATDEVPFIHQGSASNLLTHSGRKRQIQDPWGQPYYYLAHPDYLRGVRYYEDSGSQPVVYGTTPTADDFWGSGSHDMPRKNYFGPPPRRDVFYNADSFQIHSKGRDQATDTEDDKPTTIDACDRGSDTNDIKNW